MAITMTKKLLFCIMGVLILIVVSWYFNIFVNQNINLPKIKPLQMSVYLGKNPMQDVVVLQDFGRNNGSLQYPNVTKTAIPRLPKKILFGNDLFGDYNWGFRLNSKKPFEDFNCKITNCVFTSNQREIKTVDAVLFHKIRGAFPTYRSPHQRWILYDLEPPITKFRRTYANLFNWTHTFRINSDIFMPYSYICERKVPISIDFKAIMKGKTKKVAWFVGNCNAPSKRNLYVKELMKYIEVDVYGGCSKIFGQNNQCDRWDQKDLLGSAKMAKKIIKPGPKPLGHRCYKMIEEKYKFYLSFENCFFTDYITEKYFNIMMYNIVPIVRGDGNYTRLAIPNSYINTKNFESPKHLAEYLLKLDQNDDEYISFLKNRERYALTRQNVPCKRNEVEAWCTLCRKLNDVSEPYNSIANFKEWWGKCREPTDLGFITDP